VVAPARPSSSRYQASARAVRSAAARIPQMSERVRRVSARVFVRRESFTAFAQGPYASCRQSSPETSIT
jgi:hypothetical protein